MSQWKPDPAVVSRAREVKRVAAERLRSYSNVIGLGVGLEEAEGRRTGKVAVIVYVSRKLPEAQLRADEILPEEIEGVPVDVVEAEFKPDVESGSGRSHNPLVGGISIGVSCGGISSGGYGTLGGAFFDDVTGEDVILSNWHVLLAACQGVEVNQPGTTGGGSLVARVHQAVITDRVDAAAARLTGHRFLLPELLGLGRISGIGTPLLGKIVRKTGATTGVTTGEIAEIDCDFDLTYDNGLTVNFRDQIFVKTLDGVIGDEGDSGSLWVDEANRVIGLHFSHRTTGGVKVGANANPIAAVMAALGINLEHGVRMYDFVAINTALLH
ncbi:hypothetical protein PV721_27475 [Streptomyces sp. MB09-01]|uniref:hypothetical protein n=1 Tax=Streptomyces sp. MB09-01 TaxID=3028666 RepID=UPI0029AE5BA0|nr:hypothetical protein [Streptomyces sp. MB09-01]MDX3538024.1 hypothetical protein [Streptomyces sp. MB09-01]